MEHVFRDDRDERGVRAEEAMDRLEEEQVREDALSERVLHAVDGLRQQRPTDTIDHRLAAHEQERADDREEAHRVDEVRRRGAGRHDEDAREARADQARDAEHGGIERDRVLHLGAGDHRRVHRSARGRVERLERRVENARDVDVPDLHLSGRNDEAQTE